MNNFKDHQQKIVKKFPIIALAALVAWGCWAVKEMIHGRTLKSYRSAGELLISNNHFVKTTTDEFSVVGDDFVFDSGRTERVELRTFRDGTQQLCLLPFNELYSEQCRYISTKADSDGI
ncbi:MULTISPECIES: hypothetical protein [Pseudomonas]|jgi:predicted choloylglycine hydrolase|uniref:hypothetical protein n=1 Tax=Pseudomonas TaxID=286 RepID=UPI00064BF827|nr:MULTISPECIES: hypothetical protein [Pseudomonas]NVZ46178.1 hypothetical protein [Pseudomonas tolaasii]NWA51727.1 hypothetical protein [Pseudomonas tolaasii]RTY75838.1 hypothetical protein EKA83_15275 [Pseudomonas veronii]TWR50754.1 hypothetical protein FIV35_24315 [Pseudomonas rhodesiae]